MFARKACYFFVRPKTKYLEICVFLGRPVKAAQMRKVFRTSKRRLAHLLRVTHRDEVEPPITDWLREAYDYEATPIKRQRPKSKRQKTKGKAGASGRRKRAERRSNLELESQNLEVKRVPG